MKKAATILLLLIVVGLLAIPLWQARCPIELKVSKLTPSGILDETGHELSLVTLSTRNRSTGTENSLYFGNKTAKLEARVGQRWIEVRDPFYLATVMPRQESDVLVLIPAGTDACRLTIDYTRAPWQWRLLGLLKRWKVRLPLRVSQSLQPKTVTQRWSTAVLKVVLPPENARDRSAIP